MKHRIVVLGAGYAGAGAAGRLARRLHPADTEITLVNAEADFVERVRMHQLASGQELERRPLSGMFDGTGVRVRLARVTAVDADHRTVALLDDEGAGELAYDTLVYALGSTWNDQGVPGVAEHAHHVAGRRGALRLRGRLDELAAGRRVVVVGGGLTGIETAAEIAEARPELEVALLARHGLGDWLSPKGRRRLRAAFQRLGVTVREHTAVERVAADAVVTGDGTVVESEATVWTAGFAAHPVAAATTMEVDGSGRIVVDRTMRSVSHPDVYAVGDASLAEGPGGAPLRMSCASGIPTGWQAADAIAARLTGREIPTTPIRYVHQCVSLGRRDAVIQMVTPDDRAKSIAYSGRLAARYKELVCRGAAYLTAHPLPYPASRRRVAASAAVRPRETGPARAAAD